jgi:exodeoxyribonuclease V beta subunit
LYVALTRARHSLWLGVATLQKKKLHDSALGYLLAGGADVEAGELEAYWDALRAGSNEIAVAMLTAEDAPTPLDRIEQQPPLVEALRFDTDLERDWSVGSFTSLARQSSAAPMRAQEATLLDEEHKIAPVQVDDAPWHRFPRGSMPGNFLHEQLEWMAGEGFGIIDDPQFDQRLAVRCDRAGWGNRKEDAIAWLRAAASTVLPPAGVALAQLGELLPEMEFWFPSDHLQAGALDRLCRQHLLDGFARQPLPERQLHGMLKGFVDLVFEHEGRYWVLDYKSNALGAGDAAYHPQALVAGMAAHRYDIQGAIYMLALHRLLRSRLGAQYDPARQLGGAIFFFLRGIGNSVTRGCHWLAPDVALLDAMDVLLGLNHGA